MELSIVVKEELMEAVFPRFRGEWRGVDPWIAEVEECQSAIPPAGLEASELATGYGLVSMEETNYLLIDIETDRVLNPSLKDVSDSFGHRFVLNDRMNV